MKARSRRVSQSLLSVALLPAIVLAGLMLTVLVACNPSPGAAASQPSASVAPAEMDGVGDDMTTAASTDEEPFYAWDFTMDTLSGDSIRLSDLRGQWVIVNFWATWCVPCRDEMPVLQALYERSDVTVLAINQREAAAVVQRYADELGLTFPLLLDPPDQTLIDYMVMKLPQTVVVDPAGELVWRQFGPLQLDRFDAELAALRGR